MVQNISQNFNNYLVDNTGINQPVVQEALNKSTQAVSNTVESNAIVNSAMGIDKNSVLLAAPLIGLIKFINNNLMSGDNTKSLVYKVANVADKISDKLGLGKLEGTSDRVSAFLEKNKYTKYFTDEYKAIPKCSMAYIPKMSEQYAKALVDVLASKGCDVQNISNAVKNGTPISSLVNDIVNVADDFLKTNPAKGAKQVSGLKNMLLAADSQVGKTGLGKLVSKGLLKSKEIIFSSSEFIDKNNLLMDLFSIVLFASVLIKATKEAKDAPKGEKLSTFTHILSEDYAPLIVMYPATKFAYKMGGNKYRGMTIEGRNALKTLIQNTNADKTLTKEAYKVAKMQKELLLKGVDEKKVAELAGKGLDEAKVLFKSLKMQGAKLNIIEKLLKKSGTILDTGLDTIKSPKLFGKIGNKLKGLTGGFGRFLLIFLVITPLLQKPITKLVHKIFGEPKAYLAKQEAGNNTTDSTQKADAQNTQNPQSTSNSGVNASNNSSTNLINKWTQPAGIQAQQPQQVAQGPVQNVTINNQPAMPSASTPIADQPIKPQQNGEVAALNLFDKNKKDNGSRYIPSIEPVQIPDNSKEIQAQVDSILKETDSFIARAKNY